LPVGIKLADLTVAIVHGDRRELLRYVPPSVGEPDAPPAAVEPPQPLEVLSNDELFVIGLHLEQYRHVTRFPEAYWREALRRDPGDSRCSNAMGRWHLRRGEFQDAERHFRHAINRLISCNANPYDAEPYYNLGLTLRYLGRDEEAYSAFYKSTWSQAWHSAAYLALAELDVKRSDWKAALDHLRASLRMNTDHLNARNLMAIVLRKLSSKEEADGLLKETYTLDPMDCWARHLASNSVPHDNQRLLDVALDYARASLYSEAVEILGHADMNAHDGSLPIILYALGYFHEVLGDTTTARAAFSEAAKATPDYCFPSRIEELLILETAIVVNPSDSRATYYLGNLLYDRCRHREAIKQWERSTELDASFSVAWRNLGIGYFNVLGDAGKAQDAFDKAIQASPEDARVFYERDQLWKRIGETPQNRLNEFEKFAKLICRRDDLSVELASLYNQTGQHEKALALLESRKFQPWEGGEGLVLNQYVRTHLALGQRELAAGNAIEARRVLEAALRCPENLGEATHPLANQSDIFYLLGVAADVEGDRVSAEKYWERAARHKGDFQEMSVKSFSEMTYYNALALKRLGRTAEAAKLLHDLLQYANALSERPVRIDYFATSLPAMLLFEDDLQRRNTATATILQAQAHLGLGEVGIAEEMLGRVLQLDRNHALAADLLKEIKTTPTAG